MGVQQGGCKEEAKEQVWSDWTAGEGGVSNSSPEYEDMVSTVATILWDESRRLNTIAGRREVARVIVSTLAHGKNMMPVKNR